MAGYDLKIIIQSKFNAEGKNFLEFLKSVGRKYPVSISYRTIRRGYYYLSINGTAGAKIDALFQELILNKGLHYYVCSIRSINKEQIIRHAIIPIYQQLLEFRFSNPYTRFLRRHISGKISQNSFIPGEFHNQFAHDYEVLFRKWDITIIDDSSFAEAVDAFLTRFLLKVVNHPFGEKSPHFDILLNQAYNKGIAMARETKGVFVKIHKARTKGLHRLTTIFHDELSELAIELYVYFGYFEEFQDSQSYKMEKLHGKRYRRIKYGDERWFDKNGKLLNFSEIASIPCHDCAAIRGQFHCFGCDMEQCPRCREQHLGCGCTLKSDLK